MSLEIAYGNLDQPKVSIERDYQTKDTDHIDCDNLSPRCIVVITRFKVLYPQWDSFQMKGSH